MTESIFISFFVFLVAYCHDSFSGLSILYEDDKDSYDWYFLQKQNTLVRIIKRNIVTLQSVNRNIRKD